MNKDKNHHFIYLLLASLFSLITAYIFGNKGYEAFVTIAIALGLLISWQILSLVRLLFRAEVWLTVKLLGTLTLVFLWFVSVFAVMLSISRSALTPSVGTPTLNWFVIAAGTLPFLIPRVNTRRLGQDTNKIFISVLTSLYSIMVLYIAVIGYYDSGAQYRNLILVLAVQLQYLMSYAITKTDYLNQSHIFAVHITQRLNIINSEIGQYLIILIVGLPFILPLAIVLLVSSLH